MSTLTLKSTLLVLLLSARLDAAPVTGADPFAPPVQTSPPPPPAKTSPAVADPNTAWTNAEIPLHTTVYQVEERLVRQSLLTTAPQHDAALLTLLEKLATEDQATVLLDQESSCRGGQNTHLRAITEFIYPVEHDPHPEPPQLRPTTFETKNVGSLHESQSSVYGPAASPVIEVSFEPDVVDLKKLDAWPAAEFDRPSPGGPRTEVKKPLFLTQSVDCTLYLRPGQTRLAGMSGNADVWAEENPATPRQVVLTFLTATLRGGEPPAQPAVPAPPADELRAGLTYGQHRFVMEIKY